MRARGALRMTTSRWMLAAALGALALVAAIYFLFPAGDRLGTALRYTARGSFCWFMLATTGSPLVTLFGDRFDWLSQRGRDFGLAFASAHSVHVGLVAWHLYDSPDPRLNASFVFFSVGVLLMYLLAFLSLSSALRSRLGLKIGRIVRTVGVEYIAFIFIADFHGRAFHDGFSKAVYLPLLALSVAGPLLRLAARAKRWLMALNEHFSPPLTGV